MPRNAATIGQCVWVFATLGPVFGYVTIMMLGAIGTIDSVSDALIFPLGVLVAAPFGISVAWIVGVVPAILVGIVYGSLRANTALRARSAIALSAAAAAVVCVCAAALIGGSLAGLVDVGSWTLMGLPGIVATLMCAALIERRLRRVQPGAGIK